MSERYMYKITYKLTPEQQYKMGMVSDGSTITQTILLDTIEDTDVTLDSTISTHPQLNGTLIADHMYRNPATVSISGVFGAFGGMSTDIGGNGPNMAMQYLQNLFETIKDNAIICKLSKIAKDDSRSSIRFKTRPNMVLQKITWSERLISMKFTFDFVEVMVAKVQEYTADIGDPFLPGTDILQSISFTQEMIDWEVVTALVVEVAVESGWVDARIAQQALATTSTYMGIGVAVGATVGIAFAGWLAEAAAVAGLSSAVPVAGWIIGGIIALAIIGYGIWKACNDSLVAKKFKEDQIKYYEDETKNRQSVDRFNNFLGNINKQIVQLDNSVMAYSFTPINNTMSLSSQFYVNFENNYYLCKIVESDYSTQSRINFTFCDMSGKQLGQVVDIRTAKSDLMDCHSSEAIYRLPYSGAYVYVLRKYMYKEAKSFHDFDLGDIAATWESGAPTISTTTPGMLSIAGPTDTYYLVATRIAPENFADVITTIIKNSIMRSVN